MVVIVERVEVSGGGGGGDGDGVIVDNYCT